MKKKSRAVLAAIPLMFFWTRGHAEARPGPAELHDRGLIKAVIELGPYAINNLFLSGEGPGRIRDISVEELIANKKTIWVEPTEGMSPELAALNECNPSFQAAHSTGPYVLPEKLHKEPVQRHIDPTTTPDILYWSRGATLEILDEKGRVLKHPEFLCHSIIALSDNKHWKYFPQSSPVSANFLYNFSQGITNILMPKYYGVPLNSHERLRFEFKALNRTAHKPRKVKCRWTLYFLQDKKGTQPIMPLNLLHSGISVPVGGAEDPNRQLPKGCGGTSKCHIKNMGNAAPNDVLHRQLNVPFDKDEKGQEITWHWIIPPGRHSYRTLHPRIPYDQQGPIRAAGAHVHPFCEKVVMIEERPGQPVKEVFTLYSKTDTTNGIRISQIDYLTWPDKGLTLDKNAVYGWEVTYNNTSGENQDSMTGVTLYFSDLRFQKPAWAL